MSTDCKVHIYKTNVPPVLTYASKTRAETTYTQQLLQTTEMKIIWQIHWKTLRDKICSDQLRQLRGIQDIIKWRKTILQRLLEIVVHMEYAAEADQRNDGKKVSTQLPCPKLWRRRRRRWQQRLN